MNKNYFSLLSKFNLTQFLTFVTALGALITAIATFVMVEEMKEQRIVNNKPILKINVLKNNISEVMVREVNKKIFFSWVRGEEYSFENISLINVGNGSALDINMYWQIDPKIVKKYLKKGKEYITDITYENGSIKKDNKVISHDKIKGKYINVLLNKDNNRYIFSSPYYYNRAFEQFVERSYLNKVKKRNIDTLYAYDTDYFSDVFLTIEYKDINNNYYKTKFKINIQIKYISVRKNKLDFEITNNYIIDEISN